MKKLLLLLILVGLALIGTAYWVHSPAPAVRPDDFTFASVERGTITESVRASGMLQPGEIAVVTAEVPGIVKAIKAHINQAVCQGEVLLQLDDRAAKLKLLAAKKDVQAAQANLGKAKAERDGRQAAWEKWKKIAKTPGLVMESERIKAEAEFKAAQEQVKAAEDKVEQAETVQELAQLGVDLTLIRAPISGIIIDKKVFLGQPVGPVTAAAAAGGASSLISKGFSALGGSSVSLGGPLFIIAKDLGKLQVHAQVMEGDIGKVRVGERASFTVYAYADDNSRFQGVVKEKHQMPINIQGTAVFYDTVINAPNRRDAKSHDWMLRPGMTADVDIVRREHVDVWKMPLAALEFQLDEHYQTEAAKQKLKEWQNRPQRDNWQSVWIIGRDEKPWPIFVRTGGVNRQGETGISDGKFREVLEWDPDLKPNPSDAATFSKVIIAAPPVHKSGLFEQPTKFKFS